MKTALILGSSSFLRPGPKVGIQFIAEGLAASGYDVHYISAPSSPLDLLSQARRSRWKSAWLGGGGTHPTKIVDNLCEYVLKALFPANRKILRFRFQLAGYRWFVPSWLQTRMFDLCICDCSPAFIYGQMAQARHRVLRLNDTIEGLSPFLSPVLVEEFLSAVRRGVYDDVWAVSEGLLQYVQKLRPEIPAITIPNGVDLTLFSAPSKTVSRPRRAVYVGSLEDWFDTDLLNGTAALLPEWHFDIYGPQGRKLHFREPNISYCGVLPYAEVPSMLSRYSVGLLPFRDVHDRLQVCERPLKFYQYLAAGLGVVSTDVGGLRAGMGAHARYGNTPESFAVSLEQAANDAQTCDPATKAVYLAGCSWQARMAQVLERLAADSENAVVR